MSVATRAAWACLRQHRLRSLVTLAVCGLGTAGVLVASMLNRAHVAEMRSRLRNLGAEMLMVSPNKLPATPGRPQQIDHFISLDAEDADALTNWRPDASLNGPTRAQTSGHRLPLQRVVPVAARSVTIRLGARAIQVRFIGTTQEYFRVRGFTLSQGRFFMPAEENERVIVLGHAVNAELHTQDTLPGQALCVGATAYQVVGVLEPQGVNFAGEDEDRQVFVPLATYCKQIANRPWLDALYLQMSPHASSTATIRLVESLLRDRHGRWPDQVPDVVVRDFADLAAQQSDLLATVTWTVSVTSALLVVMGAVGIATLMVLVVRQRRIEIGLRRALGATPVDVAFQFFMESVVLASVGVLIGLGLGIGVAAILAGLGAVTVQIDPMLVLLSAAFSLGSTAAACVIPAILAARLEPNVALRS